MLEIAKKRIPSGNFVLGDFVDMEEIIKKNSFDDPDGIIFDLGVSNLHLKDDLRGFSFSNSTQKLDMRLNPKVQGVMAKDLLNVLNIKQLRDLFLLTMQYLV